MASIAGRSAFIRLAVNHLPIMRRHRRCSSPCCGSTFAISLLNTPPDSVSATRAPWPPDGLVNRGSDSTCLTSS